MSNIKVPLENMKEVQTEPVISIVLNAHLPFVRHPELPFSYEELPFFATVSETLLPLLETLERLSADAVPFKIGLVLSPILCHLLTDEYLLEKYCAWLDKQIAFGEHEIKRAKHNPEVATLARYYLDRAVRHKENLCEKYGKNLPKVFAAYQKKGIIELICGTATNCFLPFFVDKEQAIKAELEAALTSFSYYFHSSPQGLWLPELGWHPKLDDYLRSYNFKWAIIETHSALLGTPPAAMGSFYPIKTKNGIDLLIKDYYAYTSIMDSENGLPNNPVFRDFYNDAVDELPAEDVELFLSPQGSRIQSGFKYRSIDKSIYNVDRAAEEAKRCANIFFKNRKEALQTAAGIITEESTGGGDSGQHLLSLCVWDADFFGRFWHEGPHFLEHLFRAGDAESGVQFMTPSEYLADCDKTTFQTVDAEFSSSGLNGYAESFIDASNDWAYRHIMQALDRMTELACRFTEETGIKERCLNQASREMLLSLSCDWPRLMSDSNGSSLSLWGPYARSRMEEHLRCFTTIYESLGSSYLSTRFITDLEQRHNIFPMLDYRIFQKNKKIKQKDLN